MTTELLLIGGVDEAGRGPLAGAVYAAAVILDPARPIAGLADSKTLSEKKRDSLAAQIKEYALSWAIASSSVAEIDRINILQASLLAMKRAVEGLHLLPERILVDGLHCPKVTMSAQAVVRGDSQIEAIAAASILAKTARDAEMCRCMIFIRNTTLPATRAIPRQSILSACIHMAPVPNTGAAMRR